MGWRWWLYEIRVGCIGYHCGKRFIHKVQRDCQPLALMSTQIRALACLLRSVNQVLTYDELLLQV